ncbi:MAG TPA: MFS transporter [Dongiaceae bacterium]|jgi:MFS family permease
MKTLRETSHLDRTRETRIEGTAATVVIAAMIAALFAGSTMLTPLYVIYQDKFGFSQIGLTLIYAVYVVGNLAALLFFGGLSDAIGRRRTAVPAMAIAIVSSLMFLFAANTASLYIGRILSGFAIGIGAGTGTAWLAELIGDKDKSRATIIATSTNFAGLGIGALGAGLLAEYAPWPLHLSFAVYLLALFAIGALIWITQDTGQPRARSISSLSIRPRLSVPPDIRAQFIAPAVTGFGAMALVGFYAALIPSILMHQLHDTNHAAAGLLVFELAVVVAGVIVATQQLASRTAMLWALALMIPAVVLVVTAQILGSMTVMIIATAACGIAAGLGYRGSLQVVNQIAPDAQRAEVVSSYFVCCFSGNALPVIGIGVISTAASATAASLVFAAMIIAFALVALVFGSRYTQ